MQSGVSDDVSAVVKIRYSEDVHATDKKKKKMHFGVLNLIRVLWSSFF